MTPLCQAATVAVLAAWRERRAMELGERLRSAREWSGHTQDSLALAAEVKKDQISRWERGTPVRDTAAIVRMAEVLCVGLDWLFGTRDDDDRRPAGLVLLFDSAVMNTPPTDEERVWCLDIVRNHGGDVSVEEWQKRLASKRRGASLEEVLAESTHTRAAQARGDALGVPRRAHR